MRVCPRISGMARHRRSLPDPAAKTSDSLVPDGGEDREEEDEPTDGEAADDAAVPTDSADADAVGDTDAPGGSDTDADADGDTDGEADTADDDADADSTTEPGTPAALDRSNVEVHEPGTAEPADPKWEKPDPGEIPEFEVRAGEPTDSGGPKSTGAGTSPTGESDRDRAGDSDPTAGMPNAARSPGESRIQREGTEGYVAALELAARLPEDVRLPEEAADLVPAAVEAELEQDVQSFAAAEFDEESPHVDVLEFVERDGEIWLRLRLGVPTEAFSDLEPDEVRAHALQELEGLL